MVDPREPITSKCSVSSADMDTRQPSSTKHMEVVRNLDLTCSEGLKQDLTLEIMLERLRLLSQDTIPAARVVDQPSTEYDKISTEPSLLVKGQQSSDANNVTDIKVVQSSVRGLGQELPEKGDPTPATVVDVGKHERSGMRDILNTNNIVDSENLEVIGAHSSIRSGRSLAHSDMPGYAPTMASSVVLDRTLGQQDGGQLGNAAATGYKSLELQLKKPETKRKRVPKSAQTSSLHRALPVLRERNTGSRIVAEDSPLPLVANTTQVGQWTPTQPAVRQQPGKDSGALFVPALRPQNLLRSANMKVSHTLNGNDNRVVEGPDIQMDKKTSKSKWRRSAATVCTANRWEKKPGHQVPVATDIERTGTNTSKQMMIEEPMHEADETGKKGARPARRAKSKQFSFKKQHRQPMQAFIEQFDGSGSADAPSEVLAQSHARERLTSPSTLHQNKQHKLSSTFFHYPEPTNSHTVRTSHRPAYTITASEQTSQSSDQQAGRIGLAGYEMSTLRSGALSGRGRLHMKSSNDDEKRASGHWPSPAPSVASSGMIRRPRGFQPADVGKSKPNTNTDVTSSVKEGVTQSQKFTTPQQSSASQDVLITSTAPSKATTATEILESVKNSSLPKAESSSSNMDEAAPANSDMLNPTLLRHTPEKQGEIIADFLAKAISRKASTYQGHDSFPKIHGDISHNPEGAAMNRFNPELDPAHAEHSETSSVEVVVHDEPQWSCWSRVVTTKNTLQKPEWDNSTPPIDKSSWLEDSLLPTSEHKGPVAANLRNVDPHHFMRSEKSKAKSDPKMIPTIPAPSFSHQQSDGIDDKHQSQLPHTPPAQPTKLSLTSYQAASTTPSIPQSNGDDAAAKLAAKVPPHLKAQQVSSSAGKGKDNNHQTNASKEIIEAMSKYTPPPHLQSQPVKKNLLASATPQKPVDLQEASTSLSKISTDKEVAAARNTVETANDAQIAATLATDDPHDDQQLAAALQADFDEQQIASKQWRIEPPNSNVHTDQSLPPHLKASRQKEASHAASIPQNDRTNATATNSGALKDVTHLRQNSKVQNARVNQNGQESAKKQGKKPAMAMIANDEPPILADWNGTLLPPPMGEDWSNRPQHHLADEQKNEAIKYWTEEHVSNSDVTELQERPYQHPVTKINPDEFNLAKRHLKTDDHIQAYQAKHPSSVGDSTPSSRGRTTTKEEKREARKRQARNQDYEPPVYVNEYAPAANIYLRPAQFKDMKQVCFLHNHYILKTPLSYHLEDNNEVYWRERLQEAVNESDPFLVAVLMGSTRVTSLKDVRSTRNQETIVGFALAADYGLQNHIWRFTVELEMWVHPDHLHQGIGRSLLDRMLGALDPGYNLKECAPFLDDSDSRQRWVSGSYSVVKTIMINLLHYHGRTKDVEWKKAWLSDKHDFKHSGTIEGIGRRHDKDVDMTQMILRTSAALPKEGICYDSS